MNQLYSNKNELYLENNQEVFRLGSIPLKTISYLNKWKYPVVFIELEIVSLGFSLPHLNSTEGLQFSSVQFSHSVMSDSLRPHESQHARPPCPSQTPRVYSNSCPLSRWCHPAISSSVVEPGVYSRGTAGMSIRNSSLFIEVRNLSRYEGQLRNVN